MIPSSYHEWEAVKSVRENYALNIETFPPKRTKRTKTTTLKDLVLDCLLLFGRNICWDWKHQPPIRQINQKFCGSPPHGSHPECKKKKSRNGPQWFFNGADIDTISRYTLQETNISPKKLHFEDDFPSWDMLIPWRVIFAYICRTIVLQVLSKNFEVEAVVQVRFLAHIIDHQPFNTN